MTFEKGDLVKLDGESTSKAHLRITHSTVEVGGGGKHTIKIRAARSERCLHRSDGARRHMGTGRRSSRTGPHRCGFQPITNLCGHQLERWNLHAGVSVPSFDCGESTSRSKGVQRLVRSMPSNRSTPLEKEVKSKIYLLPRHPTFIESRAT